MHRHALLDSIFLIELIMYAMYEHWIMFVETTALQIWRVFF